MLAAETVDLTKDYRVGFFRKQPKRALDGLSLRVEAGEVFGLLGPNGAGKTTTLKILLGLVFPSSGSARILGKELGDVAVRAKIGYLPENPYLYPHLSAREFLTYMAGLFGVSRDERNRRIERLLERVGIEESRGVPLGKFSKGMVQRVGIAQALINDPELVFLDEPMSGLDPLGRREVRDLILELKREGKTIFFSTHILSDAETLCDRVAILNRGQLQGCGDLREILQMGVSSTEIVLENPAPELLGDLQPSADSIVHTGDRVRIVVPGESGTARVLELCLRARARIVSLNPLKSSLEDYFMAKVGSPAEEGPQEEAVPSAAARGGEQ